MKKEQKQKKRFMFSIREKMGFSRSEMAHALSSDKDVTYDNIVCYENLKPNTSCVPPLHIYLRTLLLICKFDKNYISDRCFKDICEQLNEIKMVKEIVRKGRNKQNE